MRSPRLAGIGAVLLALMISGCTGTTATPLSVGATTDEQSILLAYLYAAALRGTGTAVQVRVVADPIDALDSGELTVLPGFTGQLLATIAPNSAVRSDWQVYTAMVGTLPEGIAAGDYATAARDKPALAVTKATATAWDNTTLRTLMRHCAGLTVGAVAGARTPVTVGRCRFPVVHEFTDSAVLFDALRTKKIVAAWTSTADPAIPDDVVVLDDATPALLQAENVVPLYRRNELTESQLLAINEVAGVLDTAALTQMRRRLALGAEPQVIAEDWLAEHPLGR